MVFIDVFSATQIR